MRRISVVGTSGSGKSTVARELAQALELPLTELDALFWLPGWVERPREEFAAAVTAVAAGDRWVIEGNYASRVQPLVWDRADTVVWLNLPRHTVMRQLVWRTVKRIVTRQELWDGNYERWENFFSRDPANSILVWAWTHYASDRARYSSAMTDPAHAHLEFIRLTSRRAARRLIAEAVRTRAGRPAPPPR
jgi:adenylate kinase family enzyme